MSHQHLTSEERVAIEIYLQLGMSKREIAVSLCRDHSTISREVRRNGSAKGYRAKSAQRRAETRCTQPRHYRRQQLTSLVSYVEKWLRKDWAPEQIAGRIRLDYPNDVQMRISAETIYRWAYAVALHGGSIHRHLRRCRSRRRSQKRYGQGKRFPPDRVGIEARPKVVARRKRFGDWEADLVVGSFGKAALVSCLERKSRYLLAAKVDDKTAASFNAALEEQMQTIPKRLRKTVTVDNGSEMAGFKKLEKATGMKTYFCAPRSPWQRGANENCNGLLRQYFPRGKSFCKITKEAVRRAVDRLNNRPRKCLGYRTPAEIFATAQSGAFAI